MKGAYAPKNICILDNPFKAISEDEFMVKLENSREHAKNGDIKNADDFIEEIRIKYEI